jgi:hypothetical protein
VVPCYRWNRVDWTSATKYEWGRSCRGDLEEEAGSEVRIFHRLCGPAPTLREVSIARSCAAKVAMPHFGLAKEQRSERIKWAFFYGAAAAVILVVHLATNGNLGFHTDEFYYIDCGRHPELGYVDFPPIVPLLARLETDLLGETPWALRLLPTLLGAFMVVLSGVCVRRLGGSLRLQALALLIAVTAPYFLGVNCVYQTVTFDEVTFYEKVIKLCQGRRGGPPYFFPTSTRLHAVAWRAVKGAVFGRSS